MDYLVNLISNVGFPIVVSLYLLTRIEYKLDKVLNAIEHQDKDLK